MSRVSVVVPVFNNALTIPELFERLAHVLDAQSRDFEFIAVDDGSRDASWLAIREIAARDPRVRGLRLSRNFGQHAGIAAGLAEARGDVIVLMDADFQDDPEDLAALLGPVDRGEVDVAISLNASPTGKRTRFSSRVFHRVFGRLVGGGAPPNSNTFRAFTRPVAEALLEYGERGIVYGPLMSQIGFRVGYMPTSHGRAVRGSSSYTFRKRWRLAADTLLSYSDLPYRVVMWMGVTLACGSAVFLVVLAAQYLFTDTRLTNGLGVTVAMLALFTGMMMLSISAMFAYLIRVFREVLARPRFHVMHRVGEGLGKKDDGGS